MKIIRIIKADNSDKSRDIHVLVRALGLFVLLLVLSLPVVAASALVGGSIQGAPLAFTTTNGIVTTFAGSGAQGATDATGTAASFYTPSDITTDGTNLFVVDQSNHKIRKIAISTGVVTTLAGSGAAGSADGTSTGASFNYPYGLTTDGANLFVADQSNHKIRKIVIATGVVTTLAGSGAAGSADGTGAAASFNLPRGITTDGTNLFVADYNAHKIRMIVISTGVVTTLAGSGAGGSADGTGTGASFYYPIGITTDGTNLFVADNWNDKIRKIVIATGVVTTLAGSGSGGSTDGTGTAASFSGPRGITTDGTNLFIGDSGNHKIRKIVISTGIVTTLAGSGAAGSADATGTAATFNYPEGITTDGINLFVVDTSNNKIRKIAASMGGSIIQGTPLNFDNTNAAVATLAGSGTAGSTDATGTAASFYNPRDITTDGTNLYVADRYNHKIRKIVIATGVVTTLAGSGAQGATDATGTAASFYDPSGITTDGTNLYVADYSNHKIRKIVIATGVVTTLAGSGAAGSADGTGAAASFNYPYGITTDGTSLYVADTNNHKIRMIVISTGVVTTLAGSGAASSTDATGTAASFYWPNDITTDGTSLYVADTNNHKIRMIVISTGVVTTLAGSGSIGSTDGTGTAASFYYPGDITTDGTNVFVADQYNNKIRKIVTSTGVVTTIAGSGAAGSTDAIGTAASFYYPSGITTDGTKLYIADRNNNKIRKLSLPLTVTTTATNGTITSANNPAVNAGTATTVTGSADANYYFTSVSGCGGGAQSNTNELITTFLYTTGAINSNCTVTAAFALKTTTPVLKGGAIQGAPLNLDNTNVVVATFAGSGSIGSTDGTGTAASFNLPYGMTTDGTNLFVADTGNHTIRKIVISTGGVATLAGSGAAGSTDGTGTGASFYYPRGITTDGTNLFVVDRNNHKIRKIVISTGVVTTLAGTGSFGSVDGTGTGASFSSPIGITTDGTNLFVADTDNHKIRKIVISTGVVTTLAGSGAQGATDAAGAAASFRYPQGITTDGTNLFVVDLDNHKIRKIVISTGVVMTLAGTGSFGSADGTGTGASFRFPYGITTDGTNLFVADTSNSKIRKIVISTAVVTTLAGSGAAGSTDGSGAAASFNSPQGITTDGINLFVADTSNHKMRKISSVVATPPTVSSTSPASGASAVVLNGNVTITWSEDVDCSTVNTTDITISTGGWALASCSGNQAVFSSSGQTNSTTYTVTVSTAVKDVSGNNMAVGYSWSFTTAALAAVNGSCGTANGLTLTAAPSSNLCDTGTASLVSGTGPWTWTCEGQNGGSSASCAANVAPAPVNGSCGAANGQTSTAKPVSDLCSAGTASSVVGIGPWTWTCDGQYGGTGVSCTANIRTFTVSTSSGSGGGISPNMPQTVPYGTVISFTITSNTGYGISSVTGCSGSPSGSIYVTGAITSDCTVTAAFTPNQYALTIGKSGMGNGAVTGAGTYGSDVTVTATASADAGSVFAGWAGCDTFAGKECTVTMNSDRSVTAVFALDTWPGNALDFDGTDDYAECESGTDLNITDLITLEAWIKHNTGNFAGTEYIVTKGNSYGLRTESGTGNIVFYMTSSGGLKSLSSNVKPVSGEWYHIVGTYDGKEQKIYINGALKNKQQWNSLIDTDTSPFIFGHTAAAVGGFNGVLDDVRVWHTVRTESEIQVHMRGTFTSSEPGLAGYWRLDEGAGDTAFDMTANGSHCTFGGGPALSEPAWIASDNYKAEPVKYTLNVSKTGSGSLSFSPPGTSCGTDCFTYNKNQRVTISARAAEQNMFSGWSGGCSGTGKCSVVMGADINIASNFVAAAPVISVTPEGPLDFGTVRVGRLKTKTLKITNNGVGNLKITSVEIDGEDNKMFSKRSGKSVLKPGKSANLRVMFKPKSKGEKTATLMINSNDSNHPVIELPLSGTGKIK